MKIKNLIGGGVVLFNKIKHDLKEKYIGGLYD